MCKSKLYGESSVALVDCRAEKYAPALSDFGYRVIALPPDRRLSPPVASHPDLLFFKAGSTLVCRSEYAEEHPQIIQSIKDSCACELGLSRAHASEKYPNDCGLCAAPTGKHLFCRSRSLLPEISLLCEQNGVEIADVSQGYTACSCLVAAEGRIITSDAGIARKARSLGLSVLLISTGEIDLPPYEYGFIGGCAGVDSERIYFYGDPLCHPDGEEICRFIEDSGKQIVSLSDGLLRDFGKILFI